MPSLAFAGEAGGVAGAAGADELQAAAEESVELTSSGYIVDWTQNGSCEWSIDANGNLVVRPAYGADEGALKNMHPWSEPHDDINYASSIKTVTFEGAVHVGSDPTNESAAYDDFGMFIGCTSLKSVDLSGLETSQLKTMSYMFSGCESLESVDLSVLDTSQVANMSYMFRGCSSLISVNLSGLDMSQLENAACMFEGCGALTSVDMRPFGASGSLNMYSMFRDCSSLEKFDTSGLGTLHANFLVATFYGCTSLKTIDLSKFDSSSITYLGGMFNGCSSLTTINLSNFNPSNAYGMGSSSEGRLGEYGGMFEGCSSLTSLDLSGFSTPHLTSTGSMFKGCSSLTYLDLSNFDTSNVTEMTDMFTGCDSLNVVKLGAGFDFTDAGTGWRIGSLPTPSVDGATGKWLSSADGKAYSGGKVPSNVAATYVAQRESGVGIDITAAEAKVLESPMTYMGKAIEPAVSVTYEGKELTERVDYVVDYVSNNGFGQGKAVVMGIGKYSGMSYAEFDITSMVVDIFSDAGYDDWYVKSGALDYAYAHGLISGYSGTDLVGAYDSIKRQDVAVILWRMAGEPEVTAGEAFEDVDYDAYYGPAVRWARETGVINGYQDADGVYRSFGPSNLVTREQLAVMITNYAEKVGGVSVYVDYSKLNALPDASTVSEWAYLSVGWCMDNDIMNGVRDDATGTAYAQPSGNAWHASMASMATVLHRDVLKLG